MLDSVLTLAILVLAALFFQEFPFYPERLHSPQLVDQGFLFKLLPDATSSHSGIS